MATHGNGAYRVELTQSQGGAFDVSVQNAVNTGGRLYSTRWVFATGSFGSGAALNASFYAITPGGLPNSDAVMEVKFAGMSGNGYTIGMNSSGVTGANSRSTPSAGNTFVPEYKLYLNPPSVAVGGAVVPVLSGFQYIPPGNGCNLQGSGGDPGVFSFQSSAEGTYKIICDTNKDGIFDITNPGDLLLSGDAVQGTNAVAWNGTDRNGASIIEDTYTCQGFLTVGEVHFVADDIETSYQGMRMFEYNITNGTRSSVNMFWNDTLVQANSNIMPNGQVGLENPGPNGLASGPYADAAVANVNARSWGNFGGNNGKGNNAFLDTFAFARSSTTQSVFIEVVDITTDTDGDNLPDVDEICIYGTDPNLADTDGDTLNDDVEVIGGSDPLDPCDPILGVNCALTVVITAPADGLVTNDNSQSVTGTTTPGRLVTLFVDGVNRGTAVADGAGVYTFTEAQVGTLPDGATT
ncbi:MAG: thrombospondin type 3 repeat-containing protein, partial [bacterium]